MSSSTKKLERKEASRNPTCPEGIRLTRAFFEVSYNQSKDDPCCNSDECCLGDGDCGSDCCNEDGKRGMCCGDGEEIVRSKQENKAWEKAWNAMEDHKKSCAVCIEEKKRMNA